MTALVSYSTGTVSVAAGGTTVTGVGPIWNDGSAKPGDIFQIGNFQSVISDVTDATHLVIPPWGGGAQAGVAYKIWQVSPQRFAGAEAMATVNRLVIALNAREIPVVVSADETVPDPSLGEEDQTAIQPLTGKVWVMSGGVWTFLGIYRGFRFTGAYSGATTYYVGDVASNAGASYVWINPTPGSGHAPPNATYWDVSGSPGATGAGYGGTSTTSFAISVASKVFATQAGLAYTNGARVRASSAANTSNWMEGLATYSGTTLTIAVDKTNGGGTFADWNLNIVGQPGAGDLSSANNLSDVASPKTAKDNISVHGVDVASASTTNLETATGDLIDVTGTTTITFITLNEGHERTVRFTGALTLSHSASLLLPGGANITTAAGDFAVFRGYAAGVVRCVGYTRFSGQPILLGSSVKASAFISPSAAIAASYNVSSVTDTGTGQFTFNWTVPFSTANYTIVTSLSISASSGQISSSSTPTASTCLCYMLNNAGTVSETGVVGLHMIAAGTQ